MDAPRVVKKGFNLKFWDCREEEDITDTNDEGFADVDKEDLRKIVPLQGFQWLSSALDTLLSYLFIYQMWMK